jgi:hypothetical protein
MFVQESEMARETTHTGGGVEGAGIAIVVRGQYIQPLCVPDM